MDSTTDNDHILSFIEETLKKIEEIKLKVEELENNVKEAPIAKNNIEELELVLSALKKGLLTVDTLKEEYRNNKEVALAAIESDVINYKYLSEELRNDVDITLKSVKISGVMLEFASDNLKSNIGICNTALEQEPYAIQFVAEDVLYKFVESVKSVLSTDGLQLKNMSPSVQKNKSHCAVAVNQNIEAIKFVLCEEIINDKELFLEIVDKNGLLLEFASDNLKEDFEVIFTALSNNKESKEFVFS